MAPTCKVKLILAGAVLVVVMTAWLVDCKQHQHHHRSKISHESPNNVTTASTDGGGQHNMALPMSSSRFLRIHRRPDALDGNSTLGRFIWLEQTTSCSVTCGIGIAGVAYRCYSPFSGRFVPDSKCDPRRRPLTLRRSCKLADCEPRWEVGLWENCTSNCGLGVVQRRVTCLRYGTALPASTDPTAPAQSLFEELPDQVCIRHGQPKPPDEKPCPSQKCSHWKVSAWSPCSSTCDSGIQTRFVRCFRKLPTRLPCDAMLRPPSQRICQSVFTEQCVADHASVNSKLKQEAQQRPELVIKVEPRDLKPRYHVGDWGPCSKSCGAKPGIRFRIVQCRRYFPELRLHADVADDECQSDKKARPNTTEPCKTHYIPCGKIKDEPEDDAHNYQSFEWMETGFSTCSTSCGGGYRKNLVLCFGITYANQQVPVDDFRCAGKARPMEKYEMCGSDVCQPEWQVVSTSACSATCGNGVKYQSSRCIRKQPEIGAEEELPEFMCQPFDRPPIAIHCNAGPCSPLWKTGHWSECSEPCGVGWQLRTVTCILPIRAGYYEQMPDAVCEDHQQSNSPKHRPIGARRCMTLEKCTNLESLVDPSTHLYLNEAAEITHFLGGRIYAVPSSQSSLSLICPASVNATVEWFKNSQPILSTHQTPGARSLSSLYHVKPISLDTAGNYSCSVSNGSSTERFSTELFVFKDADSLRKLFGIGSTTLFNWQRIDNVLFDEQNQTVRSKFNYLTTVTWNKKLEASVYVSERCHEQAADATSPFCLDQGEKCVLGCAIRRTDGRLAATDDGAGISFLHNDVCRGLEEAHSKKQQSTATSPMTTTSPQQKRTTAAKPLLQVPFTEACKSTLMPGWTTQNSGPCDTQRCLSNLDIAVVDLSVRCQPLVRPDLGMLFLDEAYCPANERPLDYTFCLVPECSKFRRR